MSDAQVVAFAVAIWLGALLAWPVPVIPAVVLAFGAWMLRQPWPLVVCGLALGLALGARAEHDYRPVPASSYDGRLQLITDAERVAFGTLAEGRLDGGRRVRVFAPPGSGPVSAAPAGTRLHVTGDLKPLQPGPWLKSRHIVGQLSVTTATVVDGPPWWMQPSEVIRSAVGRGARSFDQADAALYLGLVIGDDREQSVAQQVRFRTAGLSHLLAVSGQNVAFVLAAVWPFLRRLGSQPRLFAVGGVLIVFAIATRLEPSVMRASATAGIAAWAGFLGRPITGLRVLALASAALVLIDPFLVGSVGFQLSVAATAGILIIGPALAERLPGPRPLAEALAITTAAQIAVTPLLLATFGPVSLVAVPANLLAGWAAGLVMAWGMSLGLLPVVFDWVGLPEVGSVLQEVPALLLWWIDVIARWAAEIPSPVIDGRGAIVLGTLLLGSWSVHRQQVRSRSIVLAVLILLTSLVGHRPRVEDAVSAAAPTAFEGAWFWPATSSTPSVLVVAPGAGVSVVEDLVEARVRSVDVVVLVRADRSSRRINQGIVEVTRPVIVLAPPQHTFTGASRVAASTSIELRGGKEARDGLGRPHLLRLEPNGTRLTVTLDGRPLQ